MTLDDMVNAASIFLNEKYPKFTLNTERINVILNLTNLDFFKLWTGLPEEWMPGKPVTKRGWQVNRHNTEALKTFQVTNQTANVVQSTGALPFGTLAYPSDMVHVTRLGYYNTQTSRYRPVEILEDEELDDVLGDAIVAPALEYPVATYQNTGFNIYPGTIQIMSLSYLRLPVTPVYATIQVGPINAYDPTNSIQIEWPTYLYNDFLNLFLKYIGEAAKSPDMVQLSELRNKEGV
jgi:hypothetical protein